MIAVYNGEQFIAETLDSLIDQTLNQWECWVVDDGSNDTTRDIVLDYCSRDSRFNLISTKGGNGPYVCANTAISSCSGKYLARIDADDISLPTRISEQVHFLENHPDVMVCGSRHFAFGENVDQYEVHYDIDTAFLKWQLLFRNRIVHSTMMTRLEWFKNVGCYPAKPLSQDYWIWSLAAKKDILGVVDRPLIKWRLHAQSVTTTRSKEQMEYASDVSKNNIEDLLGIQCSSTDALYLIAARKGLHCETLYEFQNSYKLISTILSSEKIKNSDKVYDEMLETAWILIRVNLNRFRFQAALNLFYFMIKPSGFRWLGKRYLI